MQAEEFRKEANQMLENIKAMRDEIRLEMHLAGMDAKDAWKKLEPRANEAEKLAKEVSDVSRKALKDIQGKLQEFKANLKRK